MALTIFPNAVADFSMPGSAGLPMTTGSVFFVSSDTGGDANDGLTPESPLATWDTAIGKCTANMGDVIVFMPGHTENIGSAGAITADVAGVTHVGLGAGGDRPKFSFTAAAATMVISAASQTFNNIHWEANFADVVKGLDVSGVDDLAFKNCWFTESGTDKNFVDVVDLATGADRLSFEGCTFIGGDASNDAFITGVAHSGLFIHNCRFYANVAQTAAHGLIVTSGNATNVEITRCSFRSNIDGAVFIDFNGTANSGCISHCWFSSIDTAGAVTTGFDFTGGHMFECYVAGDADSYGIIGGGSVYTNT